MWLNSISFNFLPWHQPGMISTFFLHNANNKPNLIKSNKMLRELESNRKSSSVKGPWKILNSRTFEIRFKIPKVTIIQP